MHKCNFFPSVCAILDFGGDREITTVSDANISSKTENNATILN